MTSLWGDGWFYISALGFLGTLVLFVYFLGQYRAAVEAEEGEEDGGAPSAAAEAGEKVYVPKAALADYPEPVPVVKPAPKPAPARIPAVEAEAEAPAPEPVKKEPEKKRDPATSSGGLSPAVAYLQNLKLQVDALEKELAQLKGLAARQSAQGELILKKLAELAEKAAAPAPAAAPEPKAAPAAEPDDRSISVTETEALSAALASHAQPSAPVSIELKIEAPPEAPPAQEPPAKEPPKDSAEATLVIEPSTRSIKAEPAAEPTIKPQGAAAAGDSPAGPQTGASSEASKPRKGPVWPI